MSKKRASDNISLTAFDDLFGAPSEGEQIVEVALKELHEFQNHPFSHKRQCYTRRMV